MVSQPVRWGLCSVCWPFRSGRVSSVVLHRRLVCLHPINIILTLLSPLELLFAMDCRTLETSVHAPVLSPYFSYPNFIMLIKSFFLVLRRFQFSICDLRNLGLKQGIGMAIHFLQALVSLLFNFWTRSSFHASLNPYLS